MASRRFSNLIPPTDLSTPAQRREKLELSARISGQQSGGSSSSDEDKFGHSKGAEDHGGPLLVLDSAEPKTTPTLGKKVGDDNIRSGNISSNKLDPNNNNNTDYNCGKCCQFCSIC